MSLKAKFASRAAELEAITPAEREKTSSGKPRPATTVPGMLLGEVLGAREDRNRIAQLEAKLAAYEGTLPTLRLRAGSVRRSAFANRHETAFNPDDPEFARLTADIRATNGNVQPIAVRRLKEPMGDVTHEVIFGSRRLAACQLAGVDVLAIELDVSDRELVELQGFENRDRVDLSPYEEGVSYLRMLESKVYRTMVDIAQAHHVSKAYVSQVLDIASLPREVISAFSSPRAISLLWGRTLCAAYKSDADGLLSRARCVPKGLKDSDVYRHLLGIDAGREVVVEKQGRKIASMSFAGGAVVVRVGKGVLSPERARQFQEVIKEFLLGGP